ncbi:unnamed protein product [Penicillium salamii]|uniref:Uncharacterized protein n=1 Tax=Penicillium salamii TaxID=1612424 RepID=A0A9W4JKF7_9EURO|nr:unnamed protein product [Penicillium salamii]
MFQKPRLQPYSYSGSSRLDWDGQSFPCSTLIDIILAEYCLREVVQQQQFLKSKLRVLEKINDNEDQKTQCKDNLRSLLHQLSDKEYDLYRAEKMIPPGPIKNAYHTLRQDPTWFLREELVEDCVQRGGCYSRDCGCCKMRHEGLKMIKGVGHCTPACECCSRNRGFEYSPQKRESLFESFREMLKGDNLIALAQFGEAFCLPPLGEKPCVKAARERLARDEQAREKKSQREAAKGAVVNDTKIMVHEMEIQDESSQGSQRQVGSSKWWKRLFRARD